MSKCFQETKSLSVDLLEAINTPLSLSAALLLKYNEMEQLVNLEFNPSWYSSLGDAQDALLVTSILKKINIEITGINRQEIAIEKFFKAEQICRETNERLAQRNADAARMYRAQRKIAKILGSFDADEFVDSCSWGPGATLFIKASDACATAKFTHKLELTPGCYNFVRSWWAHAYPIWPLDNVKLVEGNKVVTVPKNAKTDRVIAIEPSGNLFLQKGIGTMIRSRLKRHGIDLRDQGHNQWKAKLGSKYNRLATVDFSAASDTISYNLVLDLLPLDWFLVLDKLRSPRGVVNDSLIEYEKFSSMGNGFTFELESLIFYALALSIEDEPELSDYSIYGDDLILPSRIVPQAVSLFNYCGFTINSEKSYWNTYYRESCGSHFWNGHDITPIFIRDPLTTVKSLMLFANNLRRLASRRLCGVGCDIRFKPTWDKTVNAIRSKLNGKRLLRIPNGYGDGGLVSEFDECSPRFCRKEYAFKFSHIGEIPDRKLGSDGPGLLLSRLWSTIGSGMAFGNEDPLPRRVRNRMFHSTCTSWTYLGPWL